MGKKVICLAGILCILLLLTGCEKRDVSKSEYVLYYTNENGTKLAEEAFEPESTVPSEILAEFLGAIEDKYAERASASFPKELKILKYDWLENQLTIYFGKEYGELGKVEEVLFRAGLVRTVTQLEGIQYVSFVVNEIPLADGSGNPVGLMSADSFVENDSSSYQMATLNLYFANKNGDKLIETTREVYYKSTTSLERLVVEQLIEGPEGEAYPTIPSSTKILNVAVEDTICYVNLSDSFSEAEHDVVAQVSVYSIVNSLTELPGVSKVQISINGDSKKSFREIVSLEEPFERNLDLVESSIE